MRAAGLIPTGVVYSHSSRYQIKAFIHPSLVAALFGIVKPSMAKKPETT